MAVPAHRFGPTPAARKAEERVWALGTRRAFPYD